MGLLDYAPASTTVSAATIPAPIRSILRQAQVVQSEGLLGSRRPYRARTAATFAFQGDPACLPRSVADRRRGAVRTTPIAATSWRRNEGADGRQHAAGTGEGCRCSARMAGSTKPSSGSTRSWTRRAQSAARCHCSAHGIRHQNIDGQLYVPERPAGSAAAVRAASARAQCVLQRSRGTAGIGQQSVRRSPSSSWCAWPARTMPGTLRDPGYGVARKGQRGQATPRERDTSPP